MPIDIGQGITYENNLFYKNGKRIGESKTIDGFFIIRKKNSNKHFVYNSKTYGDIINFLLYDITPL